MKLGMHIGIERKLIKKTKGKCASCKKVVILEEDINNPNDGLIYAVDCCPYCGYTGSEKKSK